MIAFLTLILGLYAVFTLGMAIGWWRMPVPSLGLPARPVRITVIIPVRNEEQTLPRLLGDLARQTYPLAHFEVIVADDSSTDQTLAVTQGMVRQMPYPLTALPLSPVRTASPKKRAISESIRIATGELIVTTDGDCRVGPEWLQSLGAFYDQTGAQLISAPVTFIPETSAFAFLQTVEASSLIGSGAVTMSFGLPTMCNGANLAYTRAAFQAVDGFAGVDHVASGDDELLMHKIARQFPGQVRFLKHPAAIVRTTPQPSWEAFYQQRKRWASKWRAYQSRLPTLLAVFVFLANAAVPLIVLAFLQGSLTTTALWVLLLLKAVPEWLFLGSVLVFLRKREALRWLLPTQLLYPLYVVFFGLAAQRKGFRWKGRDLS